MRSGKQWLHSVPLGSLASRFFTHRLGRSIHMEEKALSRLDKAFILNVRVIGDNCSGLLFTVRVAAFLGFLLVAAVANALEIEPVVVHLKVILQG
jgi:hypothetical protein